MVSNVSKERVLRASAEDIPSAQTKIHSGAIIMTRPFVQQKLLWGCLLIFSLFASLDSLRAADLHLFIVADYDSKDLLPSLNYDVKNIRREATVIGENTGMRVREYIFAGKTARAAEVIRNLKKLTPGSNDTVLFYFTGHGFRTPSKGDSPWPNIAFNTQDNAIDVTVINDIITSKNARLNIVMVDCCNNVLPDNMIPLVKDLKLAGKISQTVIENYTNLFLNSSGDIMIAGCLPGETSLAIRRGSLYTSSFIKVLHEITEEPTDGVDWQSFLDRVSQTTSEKATEFESVQEPVFLILN